MIEVDDFHAKLQGVNLTIMTESRTLLLLVHVMQNGKGLALLSGWKTGHHLGWGF